MCEIIRLRLAGIATVREAAAEGRGIAVGREPGHAPQRIEAALRELLAKVDALSPDLAPIEADGRQYRPADDREAADALAYATHLCSPGLYT